MHIFTLTEYNLFHFKRLILYIYCVCVMCTQTCVQVTKENRRGCWVPGAVVTSSCELLDVGVGTLTKEVEEWRKDRHTDTLIHWHRKAEPWWPELSDGEAAAPWELIVFIIYICTGRWGYCIQAGKEAGLLLTIEQGGRIIVYSSTVKLGYCIQLSKFIESQKRSL